MVSRVAVQNAQVRQQRLGQVRARKNIKRSVPPPIGGWNTRDNIGNMEPTDAFVMTNMIPDVGSVNLRKGYEQWATGLGSEVQTVVEFRDNKGFELVGANASGALYLGTSPVAATLLQDPSTIEGNPPTGTGNYSSTMFNGRLIMVNGAFTPFAIRRNDLTDVVDTVDQLALTSSIIDVQELVGVFEFKNRLFFWTDDSVDVYYLDIDVFQGALTKFPLGFVADKGSKLIAMTSWTLDGGDGLDDFAVFIMSSGQVLVYQGTDPARSSSWALISTYQIGPPVNRNAITQFGGQILVATDFDYVTLPGAFARGGFQEPTKLSGAAKSAIELHFDKEGWQIIFYPKAGWLIVNVPTGGDVFEQHGLNLRSGAAFRVTGWNGRSWGIVNGDLYFGTSAGTIFKANSTKADNGADISARVKQAFTDLGSQDEKHIDECRVMMTADGVITPSTGILFDFEETPEGGLQAQELGPRQEGADWGDDWGTDWASLSKNRFEWQIAAGSGTSVSMELQLSTRNQDVSWFRTDYIGRQSGNL